MTHGTSRRLLAAVLVALCSLVLVARGDGAAVAASDANPTLSVGVHQDLTWDGHAWRRQSAIGFAKDVLGAEVSRNSLLWHLIEPTEGAFDWSRTDAAVAELVAAGVEPMFVVVGSPRWASGAPDDSFESYLHVPSDDTSFSLWLQRYTAFVEAAVDRYGGRVEKWELWNEPNQHFNWKPAPDVERYAQWFTTIRDAIRRHDPSASVASGGLAGITASPDGDLSGLSFLQRLHDLGVDPDIVAVHPYAEAAQPPEAHIQWENNFDAIADVRNYLLSIGRDVPIWVTEWGWGTDEVSAADQAAYVGRSLRMLRDEYRYVTLATYFVDYDRPPEYHFGLANPDFSPKPSAYEFAAFMRSGAVAAPPPSAAPAPAPAPGAPAPEAPSSSVITAAPESTSAPVTEPSTSAAATPAPTQEVGKEASVGTKPEAAEAPPERNGSSSRWPVLALVASFSVAVVLVRRVISRRRSGGGSTLVFDGEDADAADRDREPASSVR